jgi:hypothetical protein
MPAPARHHNEGTGGEVVALVKPGSRDVSVHGCAAQDLVVTPRKRPKASAPESVGKKAKAPKETHLEDRASGIREGDSTRIDVDVQCLDSTAASAQNLVTEWVQKNPKKDGSKAWERYEKYKTSSTIRQALENGCTWVDITWKSQNQGGRIGRR